MAKPEQLLMFPEKVAEDGFKKGYEQAKRELQEQYVLLEKVGARLREEKRELLERMKPEVINFCLELTEKLIRQELTQPEVFTKYLTSLLTAVGSRRERLTILLAPEDLAMVERSLANVKRESLYFAQDPSLQRGDLRIEGDLLLVNCDLKRELATVRRHVLGGAL